MDEFTEFPETHETGKDEDLWEGEEPITADSEKLTLSEERKKARDYLRQLAEKTNDDYLKSAISLIVGLKKESKLQKENRELFDLFIGEKKASDQRIFNLFGFSLLDMKKKIKMFSREKDFNKRIWISYRKESREYTLDGQGELPPDAWIGWGKSSMKDEYSSLSV